MDIKIPGLSDALGKLDSTTEQMAELTSGINKVISLLEEQNEILRGWANR